MNSHTCIFVEHLENVYSQRNFWRLLLKHVHQTCKMDKSKGQSFFSFQKSFDMCKRNGTPNMSVKYP